MYIVEGKYFLLNSFGQVDPMYSIVTTIYLSSLWHIVDAHYVLTE